MENLGLYNMLKAWLPHELEILSISIGRRELKAILYVKDKEEGIDFSYSCELPLEAQNFAWIGQDDILTRSLEPLCEVLKTAGYGEEKLKAIITLNDYAFTECLDLPELDIKDLEESLNWQVPEHVPWSKDSYSYQYLVKKSKELTDSQKEESNLVNLQQVYVYAIENANVESLQKAVKGYGWELVAVTIEEALHQEEGGFPQAQLIEFYEAHYTAEQLERKQELFAVPIVTAKLYEHGCLKINFLPREEKYRVKLAGSKRIFQEITCSILGMSMLFCAIAYGFYYKDTSKLETLQGREVAMILWKQRIQEIKLLQSKEHRLSQEIRKLEGQRIPWSSIIKDLGRLMPQGAWLTKVNQQAGGNTANNKIVWLIFQGKAQNIELVSQLVENLQQNKDLQSVELVSSGVEAMDDKNMYARQLTSFTIKAELKLAGTDNTNSKINESFRLKNKHKDSNNKDKEV